MKEIKFRQWVGGKFFIWGIGLEGSAFIGPVSGGPINASNTPHQQFTGLHDKNGQEIYEGDICSLSSRIDIRVVVCWNAETAAFAARKIIDDGEISDHLFGAEMGEVIGNIYESPELIKEKKG